MRNSLSRPGSLRALAIALPVAVVGLAVLASPLAAATTLTGVTDTISIVEEKGQLKFSFPSTVTQGDQLEIVNETNPKKVGPHTFSLVTQGSVPKTKQARKSCFTPKHICMSIAKWQGFNAKEEITINPAEAGPEGWSTPGSLTKKGDSWFTEKKGESFSQEVTAKPGTTLYFMCAVHPWMHGKVKVLANGSLPSSVTISRGS